MAKCIEAYIKQLNGFSSGDYLNVELDPFEIYENLLMRNARLLQESLIKMDSQSTSQENEIHKKIGDCAFYYSNDSMYEEEAKVLKSDKIYPSGAIGNLSMLDAAAIMMSKKRDGDVALINGKFLPATIDLSRPDDELIETFKASLEYLRECTNVHIEEGEKFEEGNKKFKETDLKKFNKYRFFGYYDLRFLADKSCDQLTASQYAHILFPDDPNKGEDFVRKTLTPFYNRVTTDEYINELCIYLNNKTGAFNI